MTTGEATDSSARPRSKPPRPPWGDFIPMMRAFNENVLTGLTTIHAKYGDFVRTRLPLQLYFVSAPSASRRSSSRRRTRSGRTA